MISKALIDVHTRLEAIRGTNPESMYSQVSRESIVNHAAHAVLAVETRDRSGENPAPAPCETNYGFELFAIRKFLGIPADIGTLDYIKAVEEVRAVPVQRNDLGLWTHPAYLKAFGGCDHVPSGMFDAWLQFNDLDWALSELPDDGIGNGGWEDVEAWEPEVPEGEGWFIGSIHESADDGVVCIWLRKTK